MRLHRIGFTGFRFILSFSLFAGVAASSAQAPAERVSAEERAAFHRDPQWATIEPHLPNPQTGSAAALETAADVLRARRFPEDALDYYGYALARGGNVGDLLNKMGVVRLELKQDDLAHELFLRTVRANKKNAMAWNNLGVTEYVAKRYKSAIADYHRASRLDAKSAIFHVNLGMAYFESGDLESARTELAKAVRLDPHSFESRDGGGQMVHVVGSQNYGHLAFEMARVYARRHDEANTLLWLAKASEAGFDVKQEIAEDAALAPFLRDPRVTVLLENAKQLRTRSVAAVNLQSLGPSAAREND